MDFFCTSWSKGWCLLFHVMKWKWQAYSITDYLSGCEQNVCRLYFSWTRESLSNMLKALYIATILFLKTYLTWFSWYHLPCSFKIFINVYALLYVKVNSKKICEEVSIPSFFRKILLSAFLLRFKPDLKKNVWLPQLLWIPIALAKIYFFPRVLTWLKNLCFCRHHP